MGTIWNIYNFLTVLMMIFALCMVMAGIFTAYFGSGKSRAVGGGLLVVGLIVGLLIFMMTTQYGGSLAYLNERVSLERLILDTVGYLLASVIGALVAMGIFLGAIMKS